MSSICSGVSSTSCRASCTWLGVQVALLAALGNQLAHLLDVELGWSARVAFC